MRKSDGGLFLNRRQEKSRFEEKAGEGGRKRTEKDGKRQDKR